MKILALIAVLVGALAAPSAAFGANVQVVESLKRVIIQGCDDVDPGDEDHFE